MCAHHLLPLTGKAHVAYIPGDKICGLSKIPRVVDMFAHKPQLQERITQQVAQFLTEQLAPKGVGVIIEARHLCMEARGVLKVGATTRTTALKACFQKPEVRAEFLAAI